MKWFLLMLSLLGLGCLHITVDVKPNLESVTYEKSHGYYLMGLFPRERVFSSDEICGARQLEIGRLEAYTSALDGLLFFATLGIYAPRSLRAWCVASGRVNAEDMSDGDQKQVQELQEDTSILETEKPSEQLEVEAEVKGETNEEVMEQEEPSEVVDESDVTSSPSEPTEVDEEFVEPSQAEQEPDDAN